MTPISRWVRVAGPTILVILLIVAGVVLRLSAALNRPFSTDEAESSINALTIQQHGYPTMDYLGLPIYENTLTEPWEGHPEYEFRDSSYSSKGVAVYHGWLPFYAIAASEILMGIAPDFPKDPPTVLHDNETSLQRTLAPRLPAVVFSAGMMIMVFVLGRELGGVPTGLASLTWMALDSSTVELGFQARYYSLTLFMSATIAYALWRTSRSGQWKDFVFLGVAEGLLFHTHQLSAVVFAVVSIAAIPRIIRQEQWIPKAAIAVAIAGAMTIPWAILSGFLGTASSVPKIFVLFESWTDFVFYVATRPAPLLILTVAVALALAARFLPVSGWLGEETQNKLKQSIPHIFFFLWWMFVVYAAFHLLVPAASFFPQRLTLMMMVPYVLLVSVVFGALCRLLPDRWSGYLAVSGIIAVLSVTSRLNLHVALPSKSHSVAAPLINVLQQRKFEPGTRFYASPNHHLIWTYYTGIPVQSVAPVRREFLESYPHPIVFIETVVSNRSVSTRKIAAAAAAHGITLDAETTKKIQTDIWSNWALLDVAKRNIPAPDPATMPSFLDEFIAEEYRLWEKDENEFIRLYRKTAYFRDIDVDRAADMWASFFFRFSGFEDRIGAKINIMSRMRDAEIVPVPFSSVVVFFCRPPSAPESPEHDG